MTQLPVSFAVKVPSANYPHTTYISLSFVFLLAHSLNLLLLLRYIQICAIAMSPRDPQALPSFNLTLRSGHYKTILPNLAYPSRPNTHVSWSGPSGPLLFSVSRTFSSCFVLVLAVHRKPHVQLLLLVTPMFKFKLVILSPQTQI